MTKKLNIFVCSYFEKEISTVLQAKEFSEISLTLLSTKCGHPSAQINEKDSILKSLKSDECIHVLGSCCLTNITSKDDIPGQLCVSKFAQCSYMFGNQEFIDKYIREGYYIITPGWLSKWRLQISNWGFDEDSAKEFFAESAKKLILLDTGIDSNSEQDLKDFSSFVNLPYEITPVGLDYIKLIISNIVLEWKLKSERKKHDDILKSNQKTITDHAMTLDLLNSLTKSLSEKEIVAKVFELYTMLFAPKAVYFQPFKDNIEGAVVSYPTGKSCSEKINNILANINSDQLWTETDNGFLIKVRHLEETLAYILLDGLLIKDIQSKYRELALSIATVCGLALTNARKYQLLKRTRILLESCIESPKDMIILSIDTNFKYLYFNKAYQTFMKNIHNVDIKIGMNLLDCISNKKYRKKVKANFDRALSGKTHTVNENYEDTELKYYETYYNPIKSKENEIIGATAFANNITKRMQMQKQLQIHQRMESLGTLAGGIAHDFNNILVGILGNLDLLSLNADNFTEDQKSILNSAQESSDRAATLISQIQTLSRGGSQPSELLDIYDISTEVFTLLEGTTDRLIEKQNNLEKGKFFVNAVSSEIQQVLLNLGVNSSEAIMERGVKKGDYISLSAEDYHASESDPLGLSEGEYIHLTFEDNGVGMSQEVLEQAFDPLFTTKDNYTKKGQGLGLAMVYNIVSRKCKGQINIESLVGKGTAFHIYLPKAKVEATPENITNIEMKGGNETILIIDDEPMIISLTERLLTDNGYTILNASDGKEGLDIFKEQKDNIDLVLLDLNLPEMSGEQVFQEMSIIKPDVKVVILSGQREEMFIEGVLSKAKDRISKPFKLQKLVQTVRTVLD